MSISQSKLLAHYTHVRQKTLELCQSLEVEDYTIQAVPDVSPPKWHLAHTTWFFEIFVLIPYFHSYRPFDEEFLIRFNSYYQQLQSTPYPREKRGLLSRPTLAVIRQYREYVDIQMKALMQKSMTPQINDLIQVGLNHEEQHQELLLMDIKFNFSMDPTFPCYQKTQQVPLTELKSLEFITVPGGLVDIGYDGDSFCYDNELPLHPVYCPEYQLANRLITNGEYLAFMNEGGYQNPAFWLEDGWQAVQQNGWHSPLYFHHKDNQWYLFTLSGLQPLDLNQPVVHVSYYEADAFARWSKARLPTEFEWENFAKQTQAPIMGNFLENNLFHTQSTRSSLQLYGDVWEWTQSSYSPFPGYQSAQGALGEYNAKFMCNQFVLKGGSFGTPHSHIRASYRNYYAPNKRWQFSGIRLARDTEKE